MIEHYRGDDPGPALPAPRGRVAAAVDGEDRPAAQVLADRVAAALIHHEPGWRLPRRSALARRYGVSPAEMEAAIEELAARHLLRRLPDGQVYRASPADYLIKLEGLDLRASIDPMGMIVVCASRHVSLRRVPEDIGGALGLAPGDPVSVVRCLWTASGDPAAFSATYLPESMGFLAGDPPEFADVLKWPREPGLPAHVAGASQAAGAGHVAGADHVAGAAGQAGGADHVAGAAQAGGAGHVAGAGQAGGAGQVGRPGQAGGKGAAARPAGLYVELQPPAPSVARSLRLATGQPAVNVTIRFDSPDDEPMALATAVLRPDMFRVVVESPQAPRAISFSGEDDVVWTHTAEGWEP
jgi:DNA-binding GntR family transcriptional regulator